ncbi:hypothetical protein BDR03DRAFT_880168, partial [Suillus americanus]
ITLPWKIDGAEYPPLQESFRKAERILDPHGQILPKLWACLGLGDSHGGNVMISPKKQDPAIYFIDYEAAGHHSPFLDLAKPLYLDGFFSVMYHNITSKSSDPTSEGAPVSWRIDDGKVCIDLDASLSDLDKVVCFMKLEYTDPDSFFLDCAVGILLYNDLKGSLKRFCGWDNQPCVVETSINGECRSSFI